MGTRSLVAVAVAIACAFAGTAAADPKGDIQAKTREAMDSYDRMDYEAAKKSLNQALATAKKAKLDKDTAIAKVYLFLGIAMFANGEADAAKGAFVSAAQIDSRIAIEAAYKQPELTKLLDQAKAEAGGNGGNGGEPIVDSVDCASVKGLQHAIIDESKQGKTEPIEALLGGDVKADRVSVMWRSEGATDFTEGKLAKQGECKFTGQIPASAMRGSVVHYYVAAYGANNKVVASRGSAGSPNILELIGKVEVKPDDEDPLNPGKNKKVATVPTPTSTNTEETVTGGVVAGGKPPRVFLAFAGGTGIGYVTGRTEAGSPVETCCIGNSLVVLQPELGFFISQRLAIGLAARLGIPLRANIDGHATMAPGALVRARFALSNSGEGVRVMGQLGFGILRHTIELHGAMPGMNIDIVAQGPLLVGAGVGFTKKLTNNLAFVADLSALGAVAVKSQLGSAPRLNNGVGADLSLGLAVGF